MSRPLIGDCPRYTPSQLRKASKTKDFSIPWEAPGILCGFRITLEVFRPSEGVCRTSNTCRPAIQHVRVDHRRHRGRLRPCRWRIERGPSGCGYHRSNTSKQFRWDECTPDERGLQAESTVHFFAFVQVCVKRGFVKREACFVSRSSAFICVNLRIRLALYYYPSTSCFLCVIFMVCHCNANTHKDLCEISARATFWLRPRPSAARLRCGL